MDTSFMEPVNPAGFNPAGLSMGPRLDPRMVNQPAVVTQPFLPAMAKASEKNNPMNARSQEPIGDRVDNFLTSMGVR